MNPVASWEGAVGADLAAEWALPAVHLFAAIDSTNDLALELARQGSPPGTCVLADEQIRGRGRAGRSWQSLPGRGIWISWVASQRPPVDQGLLPILVGLAASAALDPYVGSRTVEIKWPNDLHVQGRKIGGILCETKTVGLEASPVVIGVGLNVNHSAHDFPPELQRVATSLALESGSPVDRRSVAAELVESLRPLLDRPSRATVQKMLSRFEMRDALRGRYISVVEPGTSRELARGTAEGIDSAGNLAVRTGSGEVKYLGYGSPQILQTV